MWFLMIASTIMQVAAQRKQAQAAAQEAEWQRENALADAARATSEAKFGQQMLEAEGVEAAYEAEAIKGTQLVNQAAGGGGLVGTNLLLRIQLSDQLEWQRTKSAMAGRFGVEQKRAEATGYVRNAFQLMTRQQNINTASRYKQAGTIMGGVAQAYGMRGSSGAWNYNSPNYRTDYSNAGGSIPSSVLSGKL